MTIMTKDTENSKEQMKKEFLKQLSSFFQNIVKTLPKIKLINCKK